MSTTYAPVDSAGCLGIQILRVSYPSMFSFCGHSVVSEAVMHTQYSLPDLKPRRLRPLSILITY